MWKKSLRLLPILLVTGCTTTFTPLTADVQPRNDKNQYLVEASFTSDQTSLLWDTVQGSLVEGGQIIPMTREAGVHNRWEGYLPVPADQNTVSYRIVFDFKYNAFGKGPVADTKISPEFHLKIAD